MQKLLGIDHYLFLFSWFKINVLKRDRSENDFFHFLDLLNPKEVVLDIGANIGIMTYHISKKVYTGKVFAFEPMPLNIKALRRIIRLFKLSNVRVMDMALGNYQGEVEMVLPVVDQVKKQGLSHVVSDEIKEFNEGHRLVVPIFRLDDIEIIARETIAAIKMDVENFEFHVLEGAIELLKRDKPIIYCELWDNENRYKCFDFLQKLGYKIQVLEHGKLTAHLAENHTTQNFFFVHEALTLNHAKPRG